MTNREEEIIAGRNPVLEALRSGRQLKQFSGVHQLACPSEREVYAAETSNWRVQKLILR